MELGSAADVDAPAGGSASLQVVCWRRKATPGVMDNVHLTDVTLSAD